MIKCAYGKQKNAIDIFVEYWEENAEIISKKEFDALWHGAEKYYYFVKRKFKAYLEEVKRGEQ